MSVSDQMRRMSARIPSNAQVAGWAMSPEEVRAHFTKLGKKVLTLYGYSGMGYQDNDGMLDIAGQVLERFSPDEVIVNIGATDAGIGQAYKIARERGFVTTGIVSTQALNYPGGFSEFVETIFFVQDDLWGGYLAGTRLLSPTSEAMVSVSDYCVGIGGNEISRDELLEAKNRRLPVIFFPADINHALMRRRAESQGLETPASFEGVASETFAGQTVNNHADGKFKAAG